MYDVIVIGGGPSGIMAAITAAKFNNRKVLLIEKNKELGRKLLVSGGGRCNITNLKSISNFMLYVNDRFPYKTLNNFGPNEIFQYFEDLGVELKEEEDNKVFPISNQARDILNALIKDLQKFGVDVHHEEVIQVDKVKYDFHITTDKTTYNSKYVVVATGGLTYPQLGSTETGYQIAKKYNHVVTELYPNNTPLISDDEFIKNKTLQGISLKDVTIKYKTSYRGPMIFTHFGISGPTVLNISKNVYFGLKNGPVILKIDLLPDVKREELLDKIKELSSVSLALKELLPKRLVEFIVNKTNTTQNISEISKDRMNKLLEMVKNFEISINSLKGYENAIVTGGGVSLTDIDPKTMESKSVYNLYFVGEVLDLDGKTGGYNLTIALSTGYTAGYSI
ncbi:NAD(P)/FAD-dependent oxidoreductase [Mycoplasmatota bacterium]|nr:NAD(P)/FAD-dependent oxidoreductase [Mycoplasmatota bacterium]